MREADFGKALNESMDAVLEQMFFVTELVEAPMPAPWPAAPRAARVRFSGDPGGWVEVVIGADAATAIAADFLALDPSELSPTQIDDVVLELANMLCGAAVSRLESDATIRLNAPELIDGAEAGQADAVAKRSVDIGTGVIAASFHCEMPCLAANEPAS